MCLDIFGMHAYTHSKRVFCMYYVTFISLKTDQCPDRFGLDRKTALERFRWASEQSLARAGFLLNQDLRLLEAFHLYVAALSRHVVSNFN